MATASKIKLSTTLAPVYGAPNLTSESAEKASALLQENHDDHHIFFNDEGFHNHVAHHQLSLFAVGAPPEVLQRQYDLNKSTQKPMVPMSSSAVEEMQSSPDAFKKRLGGRKEYHNFLVFFQKEIEKHGWEKVLQEWMFDGSDKADDLLVRMFAGFLHPIIHLGFGVEFGQPAIIAEALAQACCHDTWIGKILLPAEKLAAEKASKGAGPSLVRILDNVLKDEKLVASAHMADANKLRDGIIVRAPGEMAEYASRYTVKPEELEAKLAEMINFDAYFTLTSQRPRENKRHKIDFFYMHNLNCSIFFPVFMRQPSLTTAQKCRLLEWKGRFDLAGYVARGCPELFLDDLREYASPAAGQANGLANGASGGWDDIFARVFRVDDDGHAVKLLRALAHGEAACAGKEEGTDWALRGDDWRRGALVAIDSVERVDEPRWVRSTGFIEAWSEIKERPRAQL